MVKAHANASMHVLQVLAVLTDEVSARTVLDSAAAACSIDSEGRILALHVCVDPHSLVASAEEIAIQRLREMREGPASVRSERIHRVFDGWVNSNRSATRCAEWRERIGSAATELLNETAQADIIVLGKPKNLDGSDALHCAMHSSKQLVLFVPTSAYSAAPFKDRNALIAWVPRDQTRRVIARALPWLSVAKSVTVISVDRDDSVEAEEIIKTLELAGVKAKFKCVSADGESVGARILREASAAEAQYLVMGAFEHGPLIEWLLGRETKEIMAKTDVPLLLMH